MNGRKISFNGIAVILRIVAGTSTMRVKVMEKEYLIERKQGEPPVFVTPPDLPETLQQNIIWAVGHYFPPRKI